MLKRIRQLGSETFVYGLSGILSKFVSVWLVPIYTRIFTPDDYGVMSLISVTTSILATFTVLALDNSAHRWFWDTEDTDDRKMTLASWMWTQLTLSIIAAGAVFIFAEPLGRLIVGKPNAAQYLRIAALSIPLGVLGGVGNNLFRMQRRAWAAVALGLGSNLLLIAMSVVFVVWLRYGVTGAYLAIVVSGTITSLVLAVYLRHWVGFRHFDFSRLRVMLKFGLPLIPASIAYWVLNASDRYFVRGYTSVADVGLFSIGSAMAAMVALPLNAFQQALGPFAMSIHKEADAQQTYAAVFLAYISAASILCAGVSIFAPELLMLFTTKVYVAAAPIVGVLSFSYVMTGLTYIASIGPLIKRTTTPTGIAITVAALANIALNALLVPRYGKMGAATATLLSQSVTPIFLFQRSQKMYPVPYRLAAGTAIFFCSLGLVGSSMFLDAPGTWKVVWQKFALISLFIPILFALRIVRPGQIRGLIKLLRTYLVRT